MATSNDQNSDTAKEAARSRQYRCIHRRDEVRRQLTKAYHNGHANGTQYGMDLARIEAEIALREAGKHAAAELVSDTIKNMDEASSE